jgi:hypothetical protein
LSRRGRRCRSRTFYPVGLHQTRELAGSSGRGRRLSRSGRQRGRRRRFELVGLHQASEFARSDWRRRRGRLGLRGWCGRSGRFDLVGLHEARELAGGRLPRSGRGRWRRSRRFEPVHQASELTGSARRLRRGPRLGWRRNSLDPPGLHQPRELTGLTRCDRFERLRCADVPLCWRHGSLAGLHQPRELARSFADGRFESLCGVRIRRRNGRGRWSGCAGLHQTSEFAGTFDRLPEFQRRC